jgi:uncharacterized membrane protein YeaQ/YmgE (transglycosylase-associated protein family)
MEPMKPSMTISNQIFAAGSRFACLAAVVLAIFLSCLTCGPALGADESTLVTKSKEAAKETTEAVKKTGIAAADEAGKLWQSIDAARLKNRTPDEIVAWVIMGMLVGSMAGMMTSMKPTGLGKLGRLLLGLAGAFLGGIVVRVTGLDFGWGPVLIRYEELFVSLLGAVLLIVVARLLRSKSKKTPKQ